jgi:Family of unknown function (DUF6353)
MNFSELVMKSRVLVANNNSVILTAVGVAGTITTAFLTGRASFKASSMIDEAQERRFHKAKEERSNSDFFQMEMLSFQDKAKEVWPLYIPPVGVGAVTIASIILANRLDTRKAAAMAAAYSLSERAFSEYKEKVVEKIGENKERAVRDEIAQDRVNKDPVREVIIAGSGDVLCYDALTGRYFQSTVETIKKAQNTINYDIINHMYASLSQFYGEIGLPPTSYSEEIGWNANNLLELSFSTTMSSDDRPCIVVDFVYAPIADYTRLY